MFVRIVGHSSGYLFMNHGNLVEVGADLDQDSNVSEQISCITFLADLQCFVSLFTKMDANIGLHTLRNTACLFSMLGGGNRDDLHNTARHTSAYSCNCHKQGNTTLFKLLQRYSSSNENALLVPKCASDCVDNRDSTSLINALASDSSK